ncbi:HAD family hydrolase [Nocardioides ferulae]|uniref:HAD family hydrolase n=1 Tax=Nocardioides ferulae TaxID=2340821 RepID=UPI000EB20B31|nr:HAD family phosphatase [Nocardioides ferulae]
MDAVLFDFDGTLVDSAPVWLAARQWLARRIQIPWADELATVGMCGSQRDAVEAFVAASGRSVADEQPWVDRLTREYVVAACELLREHGPRLVLPGVRELLVELSERGVPTALVSASTRAFVETGAAVLADLGLPPFELVLASDDVTVAKPDPECYLRAAAALAVEPGRCLVVEDSWHGARAGWAAGCSVALVGPHGTGAPVPPPGRFSDMHAVAGLLFAA